MAWRCAKCGRVVESTRKPGGMDCPGLSPYESKNKFVAHAWVEFESALDRQNKLLEEQNAMMRAQLDNSHQVKEEPEKTAYKAKFVPSDSQIKSQDELEKHYGKIAATYLGWENLEMSEKCTKPYAAKLIFSTFSWITSFSPLDYIKSLDDGRADLIWVFSRDTKYQKEGFFTPMFMIESEVIQICKYLTKYYGINRKADEALYLEYLEALKSSKAFKKIQKHDRTAHSYFLDYRFSFYPPKYCEYLDDVMMKKDGKKEWKSFLKRYRRLKIVSLLVSVPLTVIAISVLFLFCRCTIGCFI